MPDPSRLLIAPDVRTAEARLFEELDALFPAAAGAGARVEADSVRVVVPSRSLRADLLGRLARRRAAWLGLEVSSARAFAHGLLSRSGVAPPRGAAMFDLELARQARRRRPLAAAFGDFADGWAPLAAAARDLVDAGFEPEHLEAFVERVEAEGATLPGGAARRARSLAETLAAALTELAARGLAPDAALYASAAEVVRSRGHGSRAVLLHGFADATGVLSDLFEALSRRGDVTALLVASTTAPVEATERTFGNRLRSRFEGVAEEIETLAPSASPPVLAELVASSPENEAGAVVAAARQAIVEGVTEERIGIVVRAAQPYRAALRRELDRRGVPYTGSAAVGPTDPASHRTRALLRVLESREETAVDLALELVGPSDLAERSSLRLALRMLGCARLADVVALRRAGLERFRRAGFPLPVRSGFGAPPEPDDSATGGGHEARPLVRRRLPLETLEETLGALRRLAARLGRWPASTTWGVHRRALGQVVESCGPAAGDAPRRMLEAAERLAVELSDAEPLTRGEAIDLLRDAESGAETVAVGGRGGGVQLLTVVESRGRSFDRLFVLGLVRGFFPRPIAAEPVLPDSLRLRLRDLFPDLPVKSEGHDEERFLFEQLAGAAERVVLSRATHDDDGRPLASSPLLDALRRGGVLESWPAVVDPLQPLLDRAISAGLADDGAALAALTPLALEEGRRRFGRAGSTPADAGGAARLRILGEFETDPATPVGRERIRTLGPYFGLLGRRTPGDSTAATTLEAHAHCAWQAFLERGLRLEPLPDPLQSLPVLDPRWVGSVVHRVLQRLFDGRSANPAGTLGDALARPGEALAWPAPERVSELTRDVAAELLREVGHAGGGLAAALAARAHRRLEAARELDVAGPPALLLGSELEGAVVLEDDREGSERVTFRVDRASREGSLAILVDFKTGRPEGGGRAAARPETRRAHALAAVRTGARLQGAIYAAASSPTPAEARYLYLAPDLEPEQRVVALDGGPETLAALAEAARTLLGARRRGLHPPRLLESDLEGEFEGCRRCAVAEACVRGDSGFRLRLEHWHALQSGRQGARDHDQEQDQERLWRLWRLPEAAREREP